MSATPLVGHPPCATCSAALRRGGRVYHVGTACPHDPPACAVCGARWVDEDGSRVLEHAPGCAYLEAVAS